MSWISDPRNWASPRPYSPAVVTDNWIHLSGHVPLDQRGDTCGGDAAEQTAQVHRNLGHTLDSAGASPADVVATTVYLTDISDIDDVDTVYRAFFADAPYPTRTTVQVSALGRPDFRVEISAVARTRDSDPRR